MLYCFIHSNLVLFLESLSVISTKMDIISFLLLKVRGVAFVFLISHKFYKFNRISAAISISYAATHAYEQQFNKTNTFCN